MADDVAVTILSSGSEEEEEEDCTMTMGSDHSEISLQERYAYNAARKRQKTAAVATTAVAPPPPLDGNDGNDGNDEEEEEEEEEEYEENSDADDGESYFVWGDEGRKRISFDAALPIKKPSYQGGNGTQRPFNQMSTEHIIRLNEEVQMDSSASVHLQRISEMVDDVYEDVGMAGEDFIDTSSKGLYEYWLEAVGNTTWRDFVGMDTLGQKEVVRRMDANSYSVYTELRSLIYQATKCRERDRTCMEYAQEVITKIERVYGLYYKMVTNFYDRYSALELFFNGKEGVFNTRIPYDMYEDVAPPPEDEDDERRAKVNELLLVKDRLRSLSKKHMLRRSGDQIMKPVYYNGKFTWAYKPLGDITKWIIKAASHEFGRVVFEAFEGKKGNANDVKAYFLERGGLIDLQQTRYMMSFRNGVYFVERDRFVPHDQVTEDDLPAPNVYACTYIDAEFNHYPNLRNVELTVPKQKEGQPLQPHTAYDIPTPFFNKIMRDQCWSREVQETMWVYFGRLFYDQDYLDTEQMALFCHGRKSTGKSTICKIISMIYPSHLIASCATAAEKTFGLEAFLNKYLLVQAEVRDNWGLEPSDFMKMIAGDTVSVQRKFKTAMDIVWRACLLMAGNQVMGWNDDHAAIARRLLIFSFKYGVQVDMGLEDKLCNELPNIIVKANRYYLARVHYYPEKKMPLPEEFNETREAFLRKTSPIYCYLRSKELVAGDGYYVPFHMMIASFRSYSKANGVRNKLNTEIETWRVALEELNMALTENEEARVYPENSGGEPKKDFYLLGYDLAARRLFDQEEQAPKFVD